MNVLIVDDDRAMVDVLRDALRSFASSGSKFGHESAFASTGEAALYQVRADKPDLVLLDLSLPDVDGLILITRIRRLSDVPIIVLSGHSDQARKVVSLTLGADDFITKPFDLDDLEARVEVVMGRSRRLPVEGPRSSVIVTSGDLTISDTGEARANGRMFHLTPTEHKILTNLVRNEDKVVSRVELAKPLWGDQFDQDISHLVDVHIGRIRKKLGAHDNLPRIFTQRSHGYMISMTKELVGDLGN